MRNMMRSQPALRYPMATVIPHLWSLEMPCFHLNSKCVGCLVPFFCSIHVLIEKITPSIHLKENPSIHLRWLVIYIYTYYTLYIHPIDGLKHLYNHGFFIDGIIYIIYGYIYIYNVYPCISHILWIHDVYPIYYGLYFIIFRIHPLIYPLTYPPIYWDIVDIWVMHMPQTLWLFNIAMETDP